MKKLLLIFSGILGILVLFIVFLLTPIGNDAIKPYLENIIKEKTGYDVKFSTFRVSFSKLNIKSNVNGEIFADLNGSFWIFSQKFDVDYNVNIKDLQSFGLKLNEKMYVGGNVNGNLNDILIKANGHFLDCNLVANAQIKEMKPFMINLDAKGINLLKAFAIAKIPAFVSGNVSINAKVNNAKGVAQISTNDLIFNKKLIAKNFKVNLPENTNLKAISDIALNDNKIKAKTFVISNLAIELGAKNSSFDLNTKEIKSDFFAYIKDFSKFEPIINKKLKGSISANGNVALKNGALKQFNSEILGFGGKILAKSDGKKLNATIDNVRFEKIFDTILQPRFIIGGLNGEISAPLNIKNADIKIYVNDANVNKSVMDELTKKKFPQNFPIKFNFNANKNGEKIKFNADLNSFASLNVKDGNFANGALKAQYLLKADDLDKFSFFMPMQGKIAANGDISFKNGELIAKIYSHLFDGQLNGELKNLKFNAKFDDFRIEELTNMLKYGKFYTGIANANLNYDISKKAGKFDAKIHNGSISKSDFAKKVKLITGNFEEKIFDKAIVNGTINKENIAFDAFIGDDSKNSKGKFSVKNGKFNTTTTQVYCPVRGNIEKTDISIDITGTVKEPKYSLSSNYLKQKATNELKKGAKKLIEKNQLDKKVEKEVNKLLKGIF